MNTRRRLRPLLALLVGLFGCAGAAAMIKPATTESSKNAAKAPSSVVAAPQHALVGKAYVAKTPLPPATSRETPPGLDLARGWLNVTRTPTAADLRGRVVVLDFWTSCCINCMQTIPTLAHLEAKYATDPVLVVGVHTQKFDAEPEVERLRESVIRLGIHHPVAIDGDRGIWEAWGISAWPTVIVLDTEGRIVWESSGEPDEAELDDVIQSTLADGSKSGTLTKEAASFVGQEIDAQSPLAFPEKIAKIPGGWAIADSGHDRVVLTDETGKLVDVVGDGVRGNADGAYATARFAHPQGMTALGGMLYVADTENHELRAIDLKAKTVKTIAGDGKLGDGRLMGSVPAAKATLRSPWDVLALDGLVYVALAGSHQIATYDPKTDTVALYAGTGREDRIDGALLGKAAFAQPSGLATDGDALFVLDSETSSVRRIDRTKGTVSTLVGKALFTFGDVDGDKETARLQHPVGLAFGDGALWVADTYNSKLKRVDPKTGATKTVAGPGDAHADLFEPAGLAVMPTTSAGTLLLVADTDHDRIVSYLVGGSTPPKAWPIAGLLPPKPMAQP